jgi:hypothetical protein
MIRFSRKNSALKKARDQSICIFLKGIFSIWMMGRVDDYKRYYLCSQAGWNH